MDIPTRQQVTVRDQDLSIPCLKAPLINYTSLEQLQVFDNASRGPAGSFQFFLQARGAPLVSYFACLIIILALALDPFTQQIIQYRQSFETPISHLNSTVRHSQSYDRGEWYGANYDSELSSWFNPVLLAKICAYNSRSQIKAVKMTMPLCSA